MNIGLPDTFRFERYAPFWNAFFKELGINTLQPKRLLEESLEVGRNLMADEPVHVQLFVGRTLELIPHVDALLIPDLNPNSQLGNVLDPWAADLAAIIGRRLSLPRILSVPAQLKRDVVTRSAIQHGQMLTHNAQLVRRALDRSTGLLKAAPISDPHLERASMTSVAVVGDPLLLETPWLWRSAKQVLKDAALHTILQPDWDKEQAIEATARILGPWLETERETLGTALQLSSKAAVRGVVIVTSARSNAHLRLAEEIKGRVHKPSIQVEVDGQDTLPETQINRLKAWGATLN